MLKQFIFSLALLFLRQTSGEKFIVNIDAGSDDAIALLLLLRYEKAKPPSSTFEIVAITCSYGNTNEGQVEINVLKTLTIAGRDDIPVYGGAKRGLVTKLHTDGYFGADGFGEADFNDIIIARINESKHAANALIDIVNENKGNVSIISLGPVTNLALALALDNDFAKHVKHFYVMGGSVAGVGNIRPGVEFNFAADAESARMLFDAVAQAQITLLPLETSVNAKITKNWRNKVLGKFDSPYIEFLNKVEAISIAKQKETWSSVDAILAACILEPALITHDIVRNVDVVTNDGPAKGVVLVDYRRRSAKVTNTRIVLAFNETLFKEILVRYLTCKELTC